LIFSMRPFFPLIFLISRVSHLPLSVFLTSSSSLRLPHFQSTFNGPSSSHIFVP
jgi:hypothetical protein